jgi:hypothetical protein
LEQKPHRDFNTLLIDVVDEVVTEIFGTKSSSMFWHHYQAFLGITREEMPNQLPALFDSLRTIFGSAQQTLSEVIIRKLYEKANLPLNYSPKRPPAQYAEELKQILNKQ